MSPLKYNEIEQTIIRTGSISKFNIFCETGTFKGYTVENVLGHFEKIYSIELNFNFYENCKNKFSDKIEVEILHGDSSERLKDIYFDRPTVFFLDGHWSGFDTAKGLKDCPLLEELLIIKENVLEETLIIIDDSRLFGLNSLYRHDYPDWTDITVENILEIVKDRLLYYEDVDDRFSILLKSIK
jgi:hypothetical protein